ncbi:MAG: hypothetical protein CV082_03735 [Candidatus Brocadia sp. BL1]|nr:MAG: hypothetical protein CV082_03735 [Candidatus Brocadia sp. BL1]
MADVLEESGKEELIILHRKAGLFSAVPKTPARLFPFTVIGLQKNIYQKEVTEAILGQPVDFLFHFCHFYHAISLMRFSVVRLEACLYGFCHIRALLSGIR